MVPEHAKTCCYKVCHMVPEQPDPHGLLHGLQAGVRTAHGPMLEVCAEVCAVHGQRVRPAVRVQASSGDGHVPGSVLPLQPL